MIDALRSTARWKRAPDVQRQRDFCCQNARGEYGLEAQFADQGSGASFLVASKPFDAVARSDAPSAYTQSRLGTRMRSEFPSMRVRLPQPRWPQAWVDPGCKDPVCPLRPSLYLHPLSGKFVENRYTEALLKSSFERVLGWERLERLLCHQELDPTLVSISNSSEDLSKGWAATREAASLCAGSARATWQLPWMRAVPNPGEQRRGRTTFGARLPGQRRGR